MSDYSNYCTIELNRQIVFGITFLFLLNISLIIRASCSVSRYIEDNMSSSMTGKHVHMALLVITLRQDALHWRFTCHVHCRVYNVIVHRMMMVCTKLWNSFRAMHNTLQHCSLKCINVCNSRYYTLTIVLASRRSTLTSECNFLLHLHCIRCNLC